MYVALLLYLCFCKSNYLMLKIILLSVLIVAISVLLIGVKVFFVPNGKFPQTHIDGNGALGKKGIRCIQHQDKKAQSEYNHN